MESLQLAQMLADLSSLNAAEPKAATALVTANKDVHETGIPSVAAVAAAASAAAGSATTTTTMTAAAGTAAGTQAGTQAQVPTRRAPELMRTMSSTSRTASPGAVMLDKYGRRMLVSPPLSRTNSAQGSGPGTPRRDSATDDEVDRANTLMTLYEIRAKLKQQDNSSLLKAREKIAALAARQQGEHGGPGDHHKGGNKQRYSYTYPKA